MSTIVEPPTSVRQLPPRIPSPDLLKGKQPVRRSEHEVKQPACFPAAQIAEVDIEPEGEVLNRAYLQSVELFTTANSIGKPTTFKQAQQAPDAGEWQNAMVKEVKSLEEMRTWTTEPLPKGRKAISCKWVYRIKRDADGNPVCYKAWLVARGFTQVYGLDYNETHAPVTWLETIRLLLGIAAEKDWEIHQIDVKSAYLYGDLDEEIYMSPLPGYNVPKGHVL